MNWQALVIGSFFTPRDVAARLIHWNPPLWARWQAIILLAVISTLMTSAAIHLAGPDNLLGMDDSGGPFFSTLIELGINLLIALLITGLGQLAGGKGSFSDALLVVTWAQFVLLLWQIPQCLALILAPPLFLPLVSVGIVLVFWLLTQLTTALHGFASPLRVFFAILAVSFLFGAAVTPFMEPISTTTGPANV